MSRTDYRRRIEAVLASVSPREKAAKNRPAQSWNFIAGRETEYAHEYAFRVPVGQSAENVEKHLDTFTASCGAVVELEDRAGAVVFKVFQQDLPEVIRFNESMLEGMKGNAVLLGFNRHRAPVIHSWKNPHMILAGETGWGKTDAIRFILYQLIARFSPADLEIHIIDLKGGVSFLPFRSIPHIARIAYDLMTAYEVMKDAYNTMLERMEEVRQYGKRSAFKGYKQRILLIDEAAQISPKTIRTKKEVAIANQIDAFLSSVACVGREPGINLLYCTQYPHSDIVHPQVKINCGARLCFHVPSRYQSEVVLDAGGAENLSCPGRAIYKSTKLVTLQVPYVGNDEAWEKLLIESKTEVLHHGKSERKKKEPSLVHTIHSEGRDDGTDRQPPLRRERIPGQTGLIDIKGIGTRKVYRGPAAEQYEKGVRGSLIGAAHTRKRTRHRYR